MVGVEALVVADIHVEVVSNADRRGRECGRYTHTYIHAREQPHVAADAVGRRAQESTAARRPYAIVRTIRTISP